jgi:hypothetical protein
MSRQGLAAFRAAHGDPAGWCAAEINEYLDASVGAGAGTDNTAEEVER